MANRSCGNQSVGYMQSMTLCIFFNQVYGHLGNFFVQINNLKMLQLVLNFRYFFLVESTKKYSSIKVIALKAIF